MTTTMLPSTTLTPLTASMQPIMLSTLAPPTITTATLKPSTPRPPAETFFKLCLLWSALHQSHSVPKVCRTVLPEGGFRELHSRVDLSKVLNSLGPNNNNNRLNDNKSSDEKMKEGGEGRSTFKFQYRYTSRSLSAIGVLGGIVLILLVVALSTCIKNRRNLMEEHHSSGHDSFARQILIDHIRHLSASRQQQQSGDPSNGPPRRDTPPAYDDVVKPTDLQQLQTTSFTHLQQQTSISNENVDLSVTDADLASSDEDVHQQPPSYVEAFEAEPEAASSALEELQLEAERRRQRTSPHVVTIEVGGGDGRRSSSSSHSSHASSASIGSSPVSSHAPLGAGSTSSSGIGSSPPSTGQSPSSSSSTCTDVELGAVSKRSVRPQTSSSSSESE